MTPEDELEMLPDALRAAGHELLDRLSGPFKRECALAVDAEIARLDRAADEAVSRIERTMDRLEKIMNQSRPPS